MGIQKNFIILDFVKFGINGVAFRSSVTSNGQFPHSRAKTTKKVQIRLLSIIFFCKLTICKYM